MSSHDDTVRQILADPVGAHMYFFPHRHPARSPQYHESFILDIYNFDIPNLLGLIFRGGAKSTMTEEAFTLLACCHLFDYMLIIGEGEDRAVDRLTAIKSELDTNERIHAHFGNLVGPIWNERKVQLSNGVFIQTRGRNQSMRGLKWLTHRPQFVFMDDIEDKESVSKEEHINATMSWINGVLFPALDKTKRFVRWMATPLHPNAACVQYSRDPSFVTHTVPVYYYHPTQHTLVSAWEDLFPLEDMLQTKDKYERLGNAREFAQEYLCQAEAEGTRAFDVTTMPHDPTLRHTFQASYLIVDPARTTKATSSLTGLVSASWANDKLLIWEATGETLLPSDIVRRIFELHDKYNFTFIGVERDGLEEFIFQPLRIAMLQRSLVLPIVPLKAPKDKHEFIRGLQPFIKAGEIVLAAPCPQLEAQLKNFPSGKIDTLNALAYMPMMYPGEPIYTSFDPKEQLVPNVLEDLPRGTKFLFCLNASSSHTAGAVLTYFRGRLTVVLDTVREGAPATSASECLNDLRMLLHSANSAGASVVVPPTHGARYDTLGLRAHLFGLGERPALGGDPIRGRAALQRLINDHTFTVADTATWTLRALTGGFAYDPSKKVPKDNVYRTLMEAIESAVPTLTYADTRLEGHMAVDSRTGARYLTSRPNRTK